MNFNKEHKWTAVSCLQKSIRRGLIDISIEYADRLFDVDRSYLLYRLSIIAIEDIGIANIPLIHEFLKTEIKKDNINDLGGKNYILNIVELMSKSPKDRSSCDLAYLAKYHQYTYSTTKQIEDTYNDNSKSLIERCAAGWNMVGGKKIKHENISIANDNIEGFIALNKKLNIPESLLDIIKISYKIHHEEHLFGLGLCYNKFVKEKGQTVNNFTTGDIIKKIFIPEIYITDLKNETTWISSGIDYHTKEGKSALYLFIKKPDIKKFLINNGIPYDAYINLIGQILFRLEGHEVNERLFYPTANLIDHMVNDFYQKKFNIDINKVKKIIYENINVINELRQNIYTIKPKNNFKMQ